jgi:hypothetical protein
MYLVLLVLLVKEQKRSKGQNEQHIVYLFIYIFDHVNKCESAKKLLNEKQFHKAIRTLNFILTYDTNYPIVVKLFVLLFSFVSLIDLHIFHVCKAKRSYLFPSELAAFSQALKIEYWSGPIG